MHPRFGPILFDAVDRDQYLARPALEKALRRAVESGPGVLLVGSRGSGRTTLLNWLARQLRDEGWQVVRVDAALVEDPETFLELTRGALEETRGSTPKRPSQLPPDAPSAMRLQEAARRLAHAPPATILVDNLTDRGVIRTVFGGLRDLLWETGHHWVVTATPRERAQFLQPPADAFFAERVTIPPLSDEEVEQLWSRYANGRRPPGTGDLPRQPRDVFLRMRGGHDPAQVDAAREQFGEAAAALLREVLARGHAVTADDQELLARSGLSVVTLRKYLNKLVAAGLLERSADSSGEPGRPRLLYLPPGEERTP